MKRGVLLLLMQFAVPLTSAWSQSSFDMSPDAQTGERVLGSYFAADIDTVSMTNGNLHLNIPLFDLPGREVKLRLSMSYNSKFFEPRQVWTGYGYATGYEFLGWRKDTGATGILTGTLSYNYIDDSNRDCVGNIYLVESNGTKHNITKTLTRQTLITFPTPATWSPNCSLASQTFDSTDSDLLRIETGNYFNPPGTDWGSAIVRFKNGTHLVLFTRTEWYEEETCCDQNGDWYFATRTRPHYKSELRTLNGNRLAGSEDSDNINANGTRLQDLLPLTDTVGRTITYVKSANAETITLRDSNNQTKTYTLNWTNINGRRDPDSIVMTFRVVQSIVLPNGRSYQFTYNSNGYLDRVTFPSSAYIRYTYQVPDGRVGWYVSSRIVSADGTAAAEKVWTYSWPNPTTVADPSGGKTIHYFDSNGLETKTEIATSGRTVLKQVVRTYEDSPAGKRMTDETTRQGEFSFSTSYTYDDHNNITSQTDSDATGPIREINRTYLTSSTYTDWHIWDRPLSETVKQYPGPTQIAQTQWEYDTGTSVARSGTIPGWAIATGQVCVTLWDCGWYTSCSQVPLPRGNVTTVKRWLNTTNSYLITTNQYDTLGNLVKVTDPGTHETNIDFTDRFTDNISRNSFAYPTRKTDAGGFYVDTTYDFNTGLVKQATDSMSRTMTTTYDLMNRDTQINLPNGGRTTYTYDDATPKTTKEVLVDASNNVGRVITTFDKLYRVIKSETADPAGNIFVDTQYDGNSRKWKVSNPYRTGDTVLWTTFTYDAMDRPAVTTAPDSSTIQYGYANNQTTVTDEAGNARRYSYDRFGQVIKVEEPNPTLTTPMVTTYTYNVLGKLTQTQQGLQTRTFVYDSLARVTSQTLPESGTTTFVYNSDDLMTSKTDARGITTTMVYNSIHKLTSRTYSDSTASVGFQYDTAGRRTQMTDGLGTVNYGYVTNTDRLQQEQRTLTGITGTFTTDYVYNIKGDLTQMTYPSGRVVNFNYAIGGGCCNSRLDSVTDQTTSTTITTGLLYNAAGGITNRTLGNGVVETFGYNNRQQETSIMASRSGTTMMNFAYDYGTSTTDTGRVLIRTDAIQPEHSAKYVYDSIYRLSQVAANDPSSSWAISWTFDMWGNRLTQTPQGIVVGKIGTQTLGYTNNRNTLNTYDAAGNQTNDGLHNYSFNAENQITQMDGGTATYAYDGDSRRMKKSVSGISTFYFYAEGIGLISEFTTTAGASGASTSDRTTYRTSDKLGTAALLISNSGLVVENNRTLPYGEAWLGDTASVNEQKFTSYLRDPDSGLDYAMRRYYSPSMGRFASPDPTFKNVRLEYPQSWNMYTYVQNDPINYLDPSGEFLKGLLKAIIKVAAIAVVAVVAPPAAAHIVPILVGVGVGTAAVQAAVAVVAAVASVVIVKKASDLLDRLWTHKVENVQEPEDAPFNPEEEVTDPDKGWTQVEGEKDSFQRLHPDGKWERLHKDDGIKTNEGEHWDWTRPDGTVAKIWPDGKITEGSGRRY